MGVSEPREVLDEIAKIARVVYQRHVAQFGVCACSTCTIARVLWPTLSEREAAAGSEVSDPDPSVGTEPPGSDRAQPTGEQA